MDQVHSNTEKFQQTVLHGQAGAHAVCLELARNGWIPTLTLGNMPHIDILATKFNDYSKTVPIQVKTIRSSNRRAGWPIKRKNILTGIRYVLVEMPDNGTSPVFYVMNGRELRRHLNNPKVKFTLAKLPKRIAKLYVGRWDRLLASE